MLAVVDPQARPSGQGNTERRGRGAGRRGGQARTRAGKPPAEQQPAVVNNPVGPSGRDGQGDIKCRGRGGREGGRGAGQGGGQGGGQVRPQVVEPPASKRGRH